MDSSHRPPGPETYKVRILTFHAHPIKPGSEIWISFNPELETDDTFKRFVVSPRRVPS